MFNFFKKSRARQIIDKYNQGIKLTEDEAYLVSMGNIGRIMDKLERGEKLTDEEDDVFTEVTREACRGFYGRYSEGIVFKVLMAFILVGLWKYFTGEDVMAYLRIITPMIAIPAAAIFTIIIFDPR